MTPEQQKALLEGLWHLFYEIMYSAELGEEAVDARVRSAVELIEDNTGVKFG